MKTARLMLWLTDERTLTPIKPDDNHVRGFFEMRPEDYDAKLDKMRSGGYDLTPEAVDLLRPVIEERFKRDWDEAKRWDRYLDETEKAAREAAAKKARKAHTKQMKIARTRCKAAQILRQAGMTYAEIGAALDVSRSRASQLVEKQNRLDRREQMRTPSA